MCTVHDGRVRLIAQAQLLTFDAIVRARRWSEEVECRVLGVDVQFHCSDGTDLDERVSDRCGGHVAAGDVDDRSAGSDADT